MLKLPALSVVAIFADRQVLCNLSKDRSAAAYTWWACIKNSLLLGIIRKKLNTMLKTLGFYRKLASTTFFYLFCPLLKQSIIGN